MTTAGRPLRLHPDRLLPADPGVRSIARRLYDAVRDQPIISPHGHVDPRLLLDDEPFPDPAALFVTPDHYVTRLLHAGGIGLDELGVGRGRLGEAESRQVWRVLCAHWGAFAGTPVRWWLEAELADIFGVEQVPSAQTADAIYDGIAQRLAIDAYRGGSSTPRTPSPGSAPRSPRPSGSPGRRGSSTTPGRSARSRPATTRSSSCDRRVTHDADR